MGVLCMFNLTTNLNIQLVKFTNPVFPIPFPHTTCNLKPKLNPNTNVLKLPSNRKFKNHIFYAVPSSSLSKEESRALEALVFDCDGVILESEHLHRKAYNSTFAHFNVCCPSLSIPVKWDADFYDQLQNQIGGGKPKMRWYFNKNGWPSSNIFETPPSNDFDKAKLIDILQDWKTEKYKEIIRSGKVKPRPGVLQLMDEAKAAGIKLAVCSAATKSSVVLCLKNLLGPERCQQLDCFLAGDDVQKKKPDPSIYLEAAKRLGVPAKNCLVVEDSVIGLQAALGAGMDCVISYTSSTKDQDFASAKAVYPDLGNLHLKDLKALLQDTVVAS
uniref:TSA: Wollemia nobilis Ref_Wollemi_Transcript_15522_1674 transcribed RNA sequence n=1 Tax=Wollemia nobilis TaxID=56998 RepID=A0A0C9QNV5_9CONI